MWINNSDRLNSNNMWICNDVSIYRMVILSIKFSENRCCRIVFLTSLHTFFQDPYLELLIWAILTRRNNLAKYLWKTCNFPLNTAIVATCIYQGIRDKVTDSAVRAECKAMKDHFETIAIKVRFSPSFSLRQLQLLSFFRNGLVILGVKQYMVMN